MALVVADRVQETTTTTGTGTYTLAGAKDGFQSFAAVGDGNTTYYACTDGTDYEVGIGTYTATGTTLARTTIIESSNSDAAVNWGAGEKDIFVTLPASKALVQDASDDVTLADNEKLIFGTGSDLQIHHNGTHSYIDEVGTGSLFLRTDGNAVIISDETGTKVSGRFFPDTLADLYYNGSQKFKTESTGVRVYGNIVVSGTVDGRDVATDGTKLDGIEANATADQTASEIEAIVNHDNLQGFVSNEHIDWTASGAGTIHATNIPVVALTTVQTAANQTAHLALTAQEGDIVVRSDENKSYVHNGGTAGTMADYTELLTPTDAVLSVNGQTGAVTISNATTSSAGLMSSTDKSKLDGIEASADVTDATNVQAAGALMDSEVTNLAQVKAFSSADYATAAQGTTADNALPKAGGQMTGNITMSGAQTVDGRDLSVDGSKLDGIEAGATADQTASEILTAIKTVDGSGSGLDADLLDGVQGSSFLRSDTSDTMSGSLEISSGTSQPIKLTTSSAAPWAIDLYRSDTPKSSKVYNDGTSWNFEHNPSVGGNFIWHSGNDGSGSGLDADTVDGQHASAFLTSVASAWPVGSIFMSTVSTNPSTLLGFGTWVEFGAGRVPVGQNTGDASFDTLEETGGSKNATLVSHTHTTADSRLSASNAINWVTGGATSINIARSGTSAYMQVGDPPPGSYRTQMRFTTTEDTITSSTAGSSSTNANLQPYIVVKMWKRTA